MRLSTTFKLSSLVVIISFLLVSLTVVKMNQAEKLRLITIENQSKLESLGRQLAQDSDLLTSEIRRYVQFGEKKHFENFWREVNETKSREVVDDLLEMSSPGGTPVSEAGMDF
jgi:methyl-accepting chemotaxis protein